jgi:membrane fusion protein (multidrug efflux system)
MTRTVKQILIGGAAILVIGGAVLVKVIGHGSADDTRRLNAPLVQTEPVHRDTVLYQLKFTGDVIPIQQATIIAKVGGTLERVFVDMGSQVKENQILAMIDTVELSQQYQQMYASYSNARVNFERTKQLAEQNLLARQDLDNADAAMKVAKANYEMAKTRLAYARITAPFSGVVTKRNLDPGALLSANNTAMFTLMDLDAMKIVVNVLEKDIPLVSIGAKASLRVDAFPGKRFEGAITRFSNAVDLSTRTMAVQIDIPNPDHLLKPGMFASVTLVVDVHMGAITVPTPALLKDEKGFFLYALNGNSAHRKPLTLGIEQNGRTEILAGLDGSETIITTGQQFVKDGAPVTLQH